MFICTHNDEIRILIILLKYAIFSEKIHFTLLDMYAFENINSSYENLKILLLSMLLVLSEQSKLYNTF